MNVEDLNDNAPKFEEDDYKSEVKVRGIFNKLPLYTVSDSAACRERTNSLRLFIEILTQFVVH